MMMMVLIALLLGNTDDGSTALLREKTVTLILAKMSYCNFGNNKPQFYHVKKYQASIELFWG